MTKESAMQVKPADVLVTDEMMDIALSEYQKPGTFRALVQEAIAAVLAHIANNPRELTDAETLEIWANTPPSAEGTAKSIAAQYARMQFLKTVEEEPAELKALLINVPNFEGIDRDQAIATNTKIRSAWKACETKMREAK